MTSPSVSKTSPEALTLAEVTRIREDFPIFGRQVNGHPLVYLDTAATSQRPLAVLGAMRSFDLQHNGSVHRGAHTLAAESTELFETVRAEVAAFLGADADEVVWTKNATEGLNLIASAFVNASAGRGGPDAEIFALHPGDEILITESEHHSNLVPWQEVAAHTGATLRWIPLGDDGELRLDLLDDLLTERTRVVAFAQVSNVLGGIVPVSRIVARAREVGALTVLDVCQSAPHLPLDLHTLGVDFAALSGHKMLGPTGVGCAYGRRELWKAMPPFLTGGSTITTVTMDHTDFIDPPERFEAGTQMTEQVVGLGAAVRYLQQVGMPRIAAWEQMLGTRLAEGVTTIPGVRLLGPSAGRPRTGLVSVDVEGVHAHDVGQLLDAQGIAVRVGHHCAQPVHHRYGVTASTRASTYLYNTPSEVDAFLDALSGVRHYFGVGA